MVRTKDKPKHVSSAQQKKVTWNLPDPRNGEFSGVGNSEDGNISDLIEDEEEDDEDFDYEPPLSYHRRLTVDSLEDQDQNQNEVTTKIKKSRKIEKKEKFDYGSFNNVLDKCDFSVKIYVGTDHSQTYCLFEELYIPVKNFNNEFEINHSFWLYISKECNESALYFEWPMIDSAPTGKKFPQNKITKFRYFHVIGNLDIKLWSGLNVQRYFQITYEKLENDVLHLKIYFLKSGFVNLNYPAEQHIGNKNFSSVLSYSYSVEPFEKEGEMNLNHDIDEFYRSIKNSHEGVNYNDIDVQHQNLIPRLRPYQKQAVKWMLHQERVGEIVENQKRLHPLYVEITSLDNVVLYYNKFGRFFVKEIPLEVSACPGGILADEMGLGKTVEVLACIMCHPRPNIPLGLSQELVNSCGENALKHIHNNDVTVKLEREQPASQIGNSDINNSNEKIDINNFEKGTLEMKSDNAKQSLDNDKYPHHETNHKRTKRKVSRIVDYSLLDSYLDSDYEDSNCTSTTNSSKGVIEEQKITCADDCTMRRSKRKKSRMRILDDDDDEDFEIESVDKKRKLSSSENFDAEKAISECPIMSAMENVIIDKSWGGVLKDYKRKGSHNEYRQFLKKRTKDPYYMMSMKEKLTLDYMNSISKYSLASAVNRKRVEGFFDTKIKQKSYFECVCGNEKNSTAADDMCKVQCTICSLWQHADCVQFESNNVDNEKYICPHCWTTQSPVISGATLIATPSSISYQWVTEIRKHIKEKTLQVFVYEGVANHGYIQPRTLASYDMVLTSYETLSREMNYIDLPHSNSEDGRRFRLPKRYMATPSPLPCVEWWRVCLDEAQMVECTTTKTAEMAQRLSAVNRWCITGTPIQKTVNDLQGLLMFMGVDPYFVPQWWQRCLYDPYCLGETEPLHSVMSKYMWRNSKLDVINELDLPPQSEQIHWLNFTPVEEHFYKRLHSDCSSEALRVINKFPDRKIKLNSLDKQAFSSLLLPLLKLRQACDHPQIVKGHFTSLNRQTLTMEQLLENLIKKTQIEAEDAHRIIVSSLNGLAALDLIREKYADAVEKYREVLRSVGEHMEHFKTDKLQQLHTLHNLHEVIQSKHEGVHPTLRDENLSEEAKDIRENYLKLFPQRIVEADQECKQNTKAVEELKEKFNYESEWWILALGSQKREFVLEIKEMLLAQYSRFEVNKSIWHPIQNKEQLLILLKAKLKTLRNQRACMIGSVTELLSLDADTLLNGAIDCHLRPLDTNSPSCILCLKHELFEDYEENLFNVKEVKNSRSTDRSKETQDMKEKLRINITTRKGNWGQGEIELMLRYIQTKSLGGVEPKVYEDSQTHFAILQAMKKEFKNFRNLWRAIYDRVSALDEVNMAVLRYRLKFPGEELPSIQRKKNKTEPSNELQQQFEAPNYVLEEVEIQQRELKFKSEKIVGQNELRIKLGQYFYLQNLKKVDFGKDGSSNPEPCPICQGKLNHRWKVLLCGHSFCMDCIELLLKRIPCGIKGSLKCPLCRQPTKIRNIAYVDMKSTTPDETIKVSGSLSTKVEGVVRALLKIKTSDPEAKVLIFSSWSEVLEVLGDALEQNGVTYRLLSKRKKFQEILFAFKSKKEITALLLNISSGAKGLNLIEAQYVLLVEPILNPAHEFQAIGRIHRIGQDKPTFVHRFIIHSTIEERMFKFLHPKYSENATKGNPVTIDDLYQLFVQNEIEEPVPNETEESVPNENEETAQIETDGPVHFEREDMIPNETEESVGDKNEEPAQIETEREDMI